MPFNLVSAQKMPAYIWLRLSAGSFIELLNSASKLGGITKRVKSIACIIRDFEGNCSLGVSVIFAGHGELGFDATA